MGTIVDMKLYAYIFICLAMIAVGWFYRGEHDAKELANAIQEAQQRFQTQRAGQEKERQNLEKQIASDRAKSEQSLRKLLKENSQLRAEADARVDISFLVYSRLCESAEECAVFYGQGASEATSKTERNSSVSALEIYTLIQRMDDIIVEHNLSLNQLSEQIASCKR